MSATGNGTLEDGAGPESCGRAKSPLDGRRTENLVAI